MTIAAIAPVRLGARDAIVPPVPPPSSWIPVPSVPAPVGRLLTESALTESAAAVEAQQEQEVRPEPRSRDEVRFVFLSDETTTMSSGNRGDVERARSLRSGGEPILWFMRDGKEYVVRDPGR